MFQSSDSNKGRWEGLVATKGLAVKCTEEAQFDLQGVQEYSSTLHGSTASVHHCRGVCILRLILAFHAVKYCTQCPTLGFRKLSCGVQNSLVAFGSEPPFQVVFV